MPKYRFDHFEFDTENLQLREHKTLIALRPKTAVLLAVLIEQRQHLLSKKALFSQVWHSDFVQDQSLFQAISEIRKTLAPLQPIKTHPNLGYQWVAPIKVVPQQRWTKRFALAAIPVIAIGTLWINQSQSPTRISDRTSGLNITQSMLQSPAMKAFSQGIESLNKRELTAAFEYFELAGRENPLLLEAGMMKAEILFEQADYVAAEALTNELLVRAIAQNEHYVEVSAQGLLSRISEQTGQLGNALDWALQADSNARDQGFACVAENTRIRIAGLLSESELPVNKVGEINSRELTPPLAKEKAALATDYPDASHCESMQDRSKADSIQPDLSQCLDLSDDYERLAVLKMRRSSALRQA